MDYEKKLKDALDDKLVPVEVQEWIEENFPELVESEDERMIQYFKDLAPFDKAEELYEKYGFSHEDAIAWLEKQGEIIPSEDELEALRIAAYEPYKNWSEKLQSLYMKLSHCEQCEQKSADKRVKED